jgi:hypothetical protein
MEKALSTTDILQKLPWVEVLTYDELCKYGSIFDIMNNDNKHAFVLLYMSKRRFGHWTCVFLDDLGAIEVFDSYGIERPDDELELISKNFREISYQDQPYLSDLLHKSGKEIQVNDHQFQSYGEGINTCGRWVILRLMCKCLTIQEFIKEFSFVDDKTLANVV